MDELEFRKRVYNDPNHVDQELLDAASTNPALQTILDETRALEKELQAVATSITAPAGLADKLHAISASNGDATDNAASKPSSNSFFQYYAMAASLVLAAGIAIVATLTNPSRYSVAALEIEFIDHLYHEIREIDALRNGVDFSTMATPEVVRVMAAADTQFSDDNFLQSVPVKFAKPCVVIPTYHSAHLMVQGSRGAVNVFVINNSPVTNEYSINDNRFDGVIIPLGGGNLVLIGEKDEDLDQYKSLFAQNVEWVI